jgi:EAL domain-containing protein (putative c-di-GMP-specific phosphodiesterase class I)
VPVRVGVYPYSIGYVEVNIACDRAKFASDKQRDSYLSNYNYFNEEMHKKIENSRYIINNLDRAFEEGWIKVYYQPIFCAKNEHICDEEALARWFDPVRGFISPGEFIPVLEGSRQIYKLDLYVLDQIIIKMQKQREAGLEIVPHSLNLSRVDFDECDIIEEIRQRIDDAGIPRDKLTIEITESVVGSDFDFMREQVERLQELGFQVWMDDFGSGYSSLDVLQDIHFDLIKFDMRFMHRFGEGEETKIILTQLYKMAAELGIETVAEGVEAKEQVDFLKEVGCTRLQGFYYCKAISMEDIMENYEKAALRS